MNSKFTLHLCLSLSVLMLTCGGKPKTDRVDVLSPLNQKLKEFGTDTLLITSSIAIDEFPLWSANGSKVAVNLEDHWFDVDLNAIIIESAKWRQGQTLAITKDLLEPAVVAPDEIVTRTKNARFSPRKIATDGESTTIELREAGLGIQLVIQQKGKNEVIRWATAGENCHSLVLAPDQLWVAFICEQNGMILMRIA